MEKNIRWPTFKYAFTGANVHPFDIVIEKKQTIGETGPSEELLFKNFWERIYNTNPIINHEAFLNHHYFEFPLRGRSSFLKVIRFKLMEHKSLREKTNEYQNHIDNIIIHWLDKAEIDIKGKILTEIIGQPLVNTIKFRAYIANIGSKLAPVGLEISEILLIITPVEDFIYKIARNLKKVNLREPAEIEAFATLINTINLCTLLINSEYKKYPSFGMDILKNNCNSTIIEINILIDLASKNLESFKEIPLETYSYYLDEINRFKKTLKKYSIVVDPSIEVLAKDESQKPVKVKIKWNGSQKQLFSVFRQLKGTNKNGQPYIENSYDELALFLMSVSGGKSLAFRRRL